MKFEYRLTFLALSLLFCYVPVIGASVPNISRSDNCAWLSSSRSLSSRCNQESMYVIVQRIFLLSDLIRDWKKVPKKISENLDPKFYENPLISSRFVAE
jgi:hypothetical protein